MKSQKPEIIKLVHLEEIIDKKEIIRLDKDSEIPTGSDILYKAIDNTPMVYKDLTEIYKKEKRLFFTASFESYCKFDHKEKKFTKVNEGLLREEYSINLDEFVNGRVYLLSPIKL